VCVISRSEDISAHKDGHRSLLTGQYMLLLNSHSGSVRSAPEQ
jgi:hypothetical protein